VDASYLRKEKERVIHERHRSINSTLLVKPVVFSPNSHSGRGTSMSDCSSFR